MGYSLWGHKESDMTEPLTLLLKTTPKTSGTNKQIQSSVGYQKNTCTKISHISIYEQWIPKRNLRKQSHLQWCQKELIA